MEYTQLMAVLDDCCNRHIPMTIFWDNGCVFKSSGNLGSSETNNGLEPEEKGYLEYYACWVKVGEIMASPQRLASNTVCGNFKVGEGVELSLLNQPLKIEAEDGTLLWSRDRDFGPWVR